MISLPVLPSQTNVRAMLRLRAGVFMIMIMTVMIKCAPEEDRIFQMPGQPEDQEAHHYAGYLHIGHGIHLFYWFFLRQYNPHEAPLVIWIQGGRAYDGQIGGFICSGLISAIGYIGPWKFLDPSDTLVPNNYTWTKVANMLHLDFGPNSGYSYATEEVGYFDDYQVANNTRTAIYKFFDKFPEYSRNELFLSGESRGFTYAMILADSLMNDNNVNFQGLYILSGISSEMYTLNTEVPYLYHHGMLGKQELRSYLEHCCGTDKLRSCQMFLDPTPNTTCADVVADFAIGLNSEYIYGKCGIVPDPSKPGGRSKCADDGAYLFTLIENYLNRRDVKAALRVNLEATWKVCSYDSNFVVTGIPVMPIIRRFITEGKRITFTFADADSLATVNNQLLFEDMGLQAVGEHQPWFYHDEDDRMRIGGFVQTYQDNITYATIMNTGHVQASINPAPVYNFVKRFITKSDPVFGNDH